MQNYYVKSTSKIHIPEMTKIQLENFYIIEVWFHEKMVKILCRKNTSSEMKWDILITTAILS